MTRIIGAYRYEEVRQACHHIKERNEEIIAAWANVLAEKIGPNTVLIPVPGHEGYASYTARLAQEIAYRTRILGIPNVIARDLLKGKERPSLCELKHEGIPVTDTDLGLSWKHLFAKAEYKRLTAKGYRPVIVDNVIDTGYTLRHCLDLMPGADAVVIAITDCPQRKAYLTNVEYLNK